SQTSTRRPPSGVETSTAGASGLSKTISGTADHRLRARARRGARAPARASSSLLERYRVLGARRVLECPGRGSVKMRPGLRGAREDDEAGFFGDGVDERVRPEGFALHRGVGEDERDGRAFAAHAGDGAQRGAQLRRPRVSRGARVEWTIPPARADLARGERARVEVEPAKPESVMLDVVVGGDVRRR